MSDDIDPRDPENYLIYPLIDDTFTSNNINTIDFKRHLKANEALVKKVVKDLSGRPVKAEYFHGDTLMAVIHFTFTVDTNNLLRGRTETLHYIDLNNLEGPPIKIKSKTYDVNDPADLEDIVNERVMARKSIVSTLKGTLSGILQMAGYTQSQSLSLGAALWDAQGSLINNFIEFGTEGWRNELINMSLVAPFEWLAIPVDQNGTTIRDFIVARLTY